MSKNLLGRLMIAPPEIFTRVELVKKVEATLRGGGALVEFHDKGASDDVFCETAEAIQRVANGQGVPFVVSARFEIARQLNADGFHAERWDASLLEIRRRLGADKLLGVDIPVDPRAALEAQRAGVDYVRLGPVDAYAPEAKKGLITLSTLQDICQAGLSVPIYAFGGISLSTVERVLESGAYGVALVSNAYDAEDPEQKARLFMQKIQAWVGVEREPRA